MISIEDIQYCEKGDWVNGKYVPMDKCIAFRISGSNTVQIVERSETFCEPFRIHLERYGKMPLYVPPSILIRQSKAKPKNEFIIESPNERFILNVLINSITKVLSKTAIRHCEWSFSGGEKPCLKLKLGHSVRKALYLQDTINAILMALPGCTGFECKAIIY